MSDIPRYPGCYDGLTFKQAELLSFIRAYMARSKGIAPSFEEMKDGVGLSSKSGIHRLLGGLSERGYIEREEGRSRWLMVHDKPKRDRQGLRPLYLASTDGLVAELKSRGFTFSGAWA